MKDKLEVWFDIREAAVEAAFPPLTITERQI